MTQPAGDWLGCVQLLLNGESTPDPKEQNPTQASTSVQEQDFTEATTSVPRSSLEIQSTHRQDPSSDKPPVLPRNYAGRVTMSHSILGGRTCRSLESSPRPTRG